LWIPALRFATDGTTNFSTELGGRPRSLSSVFRLQLCFALIRPDRRARFGALPHLGLQSGLRRYIRALGSHFFFNAFLSLDPDSLDDPSLRNLEAAAAEILDHCPALPFWIRLNQID
jgi:hypothetical protein